jgi:hypothetical protein
MKKVFLLWSIVAINVLLIPTLYAERCEGNACGDVKIKYEGGCYHAVNSGSRKVKVEFSPGGIYGTASKVLSPGEDWKPQLLGGNCLSAYIDPYRANYADSAKASEGKGEAVRSAEGRPAIVESRDGGSCHVTTPLPIGS